MTTLGIDYGMSKIGIAVSDIDAEIATPVSVIQISQAEKKANILAITAISEICDLITKWQVEKIVLGLPLNPDGKETDKCHEIRKFAEQIALQAKTKSGITLAIDFYPEYYTTKFANQGNSRKNKQKMGDANAANYILQLYLDWKNSGI